MPRHESKQCPRCQSGFECKVGAVWQCQCSRVELSAEQLEYIRAQYADCLCYECLEDLRAEYNFLSHHHKIKRIMVGWGK